MLLLIMKNVNIIILRIGTYYVLLFVFDRRSDTWTETK